MALGCLVLPFVWAALTIASDSESDIHEQLLCCVRCLVASIEEHWAQDRKGRAPCPGKVELSMTATLAKRRQCIADRQAAFAHSIFGNAAGGVSKPEE